MVWYSYLLKNFPQFVVIHIVKDFSVVNKVDVFLGFSCFFYDPMDVGNFISVPLPFLNSACTSGIPRLTNCSSLKDFGALQINLYFIANRLL